MVTFRTSKKWLTRKLSGLCPKQVKEKLFGWKGDEFELHARAAVAGPVTATGREGLTFRSEVAAEGDNSRVLTTAHVSRRRVHW